MSWDDIFGHERIKQLWQAHLRDGQVASAYLLVGPEGIGKRRLALEMAKAINCLEGDASACGRCPSCRLIARQSHPDVHLLEPQSASRQILIEPVQHVLGRLALRPYSGKAQVAIIDGADRLTEEAANCLLKALEEPPGHAMFLLVTSQLPHCLPTIVSRCQVLRCRPLPSAMVEPHEPLLSMLAAEPSAWLQGPLPETRADVVILVDAMIAWLRDLALVAAGDARWLRHRAHEAALRRQAARLDPDRCADAAFELLALRESVEQFVSPRLVASLAREQWLCLHERAHV